MLPRYYGSLQEHNIPTCHCRPQRKRCPKASKSPAFGSLLRNGFCKRKTACRRHLWMSLSDFVLLRRPACAHSFVCTLGVETPTRGCTLQKQPTYLVSNEIGRPLHPIQSSHVAAALAVAVFFPLAKGRVFAAGPATSPGSACDFVASAFAFGWGFFLDFPAFEPEVPPSKAAFNESTAARSPATR